MVTKGERDRYMLLYAKEMNNKDTLYSKGNDSQYLTINHNGEKSF